MKEDEEGRGWRQRNGVGSRCGREFHRQERYSEFLTDGNEESVPEEAREYTKARVLERQLCSSRKWRERQNEPIQTVLYTCHLRDTCE